MSSRRRGIWMIVGVAVVLMIGTVGFVVARSTAIESWVGSQLLKVGGHYMNPDLRFDRLTYVRPRTVILDNLTLTSPDPANPGQTVVILRVKRARIELAEIPRRGQPLTFSAVILESPEFHAIAQTPGGAKLVGFSNLVKSSEESEKSSSNTPAAPLKFSDLLLLRRVEIVNAKVSYDSRPDMPPIWLNGINARLDFTPMDASASPGLYTIATTVSLPAFSLDLKGQLNIDTLTLELSQLALNLDLQEKNTHFLPSELQNMLHRFEVTGQLHVAASGTLPLTNFRGSTLQCAGELNGARLAVGQMGLSIGSWIWDVNMDDGVATIRKADAKLLGGEMHLAGTIPLDGATAAQLELSATNLQIQQILRSAKADELPPFAGEVSAKITFDGPLATWNTEAGGKGTFTVRRGRIDQLPVVGPIVGTINSVLTPGQVDRTLTDSADGEFVFDGGCVRFESLSATSGAVAFRGTGTIGFDRSLDLRVNGGPMERLQDSLGGIGKMWASASAAVAGYHVSGTLEDPKVSMEIGGGPK